MALLRLLFLNSKRACFACVFEISSKHCQCNGCSKCSQQPAQPTHIALPAAPLLCTYRSRWASRLNRLERFGTKLCNALLALAISSSCCCACCALALLTQPWGLMQNGGSTATRAACTLR